MATKPQAGGQLSLFPNEGEPGQPNPNTAGQLEQDITQEPTPEQKAAAAALRVAQLEEENNDRRSMYGGW